MVLGLCVGVELFSREERENYRKGFIQEAEGSDSAANYEARKPA